MYLFEEDKFRSSEIASVSWGGGDGALPPEKTLLESPHCLSLAWGVGLAYGPRSACGRGKAEQLNMMGLGLWGRQGGAAKHDSQRRNKCPANVFAISDYMGVL